MAKNAPSTTRIYQFVFGLIFLFVSYGAVRTMMFGSVTNAKQIAFLSIAFAVVMWLDRLYWLVLPLCLTLNINIPGIPFNSSELGCMALAAMHFVRSCLHRDPSVPWNRKILVAFPLFLWIIAFWIINPAGMNFLHSESMGGRFYLKVLLGFLAMVSLSSIRIGRSDCKILFRVLVFGAVLSIVLTLANPKLLDVGDSSTEEVGSRYVLLTFSGLYYLIWSQYSVPQVLSSLKLLLITGLSTAALALSGKRSSTASVALIPIYRALLTRRDRGITCLIGVIAFALLSILVAMDGHYIDIPQSSKRALAMVFPKYRTKGHEGMHDTFRSEMAMRARQLIRKHPWVGRKGFRMDSQTMYWLVAGHDGAFDGHEFVGAWHSAFYAYAADFGIPCLLFYLVFVWYSLRLAFRYAVKIPLGTSQSASFLYYSYLIIHSTVLIYTSGHSSMSTMDGMVRFGMLIAIANGFDYEQDKLAEWTEENRQAPQTTPMVMGV